MRELAPTLGLTQGLQVEIDLGVLFRRVDANDKGGRINLVGFEFQAHPLSIGRKGGEFVDPRNVGSALCSQRSNLFLILYDFDFDSVQRSVSRCPNKREKPSACRKTAARRLGNCS